MKVTCAAALVGMVGVSAFQMPMQARNLASRAATSGSSTSLAAVLSNEEVRVEGVEEDCAVSCWSIISRDVLYIGRRK